MQHKDDPGQLTVTEDDLDGVLPWTVIRLGRAMQRMLTEALAEHDLNPIQFGVLAQLEAHQALSQADVARAVGIRAQSAREVVAGLEQRGLLVRRGPGGRGRRTLIELSDAGRALLARTWPLVSDPDLGAALSVDEQADLNSRLHELLRALNR